MVRNKEYGICNKYNYRKRLVIAINSHLYQDTVNAPWATALRLIGYAICYFILYIYIYNFSKNLKNLNSQKFFR